MVGFKQSANADNTRDQKLNLSFVTKKFLVALCLVFDTDFRSAIRVPLGCQISEILRSLNYINSPVGSIDFL
jgi:hypothetical protein